ncbi:MAG: YggT family protein [Proteobacteria bacterium]|nr:YggT family protein [Pseudomonadota bacterium]
MYVLGFPLLSIIGIVDALLSAYSIVVILACILSLTNADQHNTIVRIINNLTVPVFIYFKKFIPSFGMIDLTPLVILLILSFIRGGILPIFITFAEGLIK